MYFMLYETYKYSLVDRVICTFLCASGILAFGSLAAFAGVHQVLRLQDDVVLYHLSLLPRADLRKVAAARRRAVETIANVEGVREVKVLVMRSHLLIEHRELALLQVFILQRHRLIHFLDPRVVLDRHADLSSATRGLL